MGYRKAVGSDEKPPPNCSWITLQPSKAPRLPTSVRNGDDPRRRAEPPSPEDPDMLSAVSWTSDEAPTCPRRPDSRRLNPHRPSPTQSTRHEMERRRTPQD